ncbi:hypothetical protein, partial [Burkholderia ubonensis]|uniref:hypothetical protein n=1 Tax=Burkholderia ubonensis TaxID=101571 RepID=UPI001E36136F
SGGCSFSSSQHPISIQVLHLKLESKLARPHITFHIGYRLDCPAIRLVKRISKPRQPGTHVRGFDLFDNSFTEIESSNGHADPTTH